MIEIGSEVLTSQLRELLATNLFVLATFLLLVCLIRRKQQSSPLTLYYDKTSSLMQEFAEKSKIKSMIYTPHLLCITGFSHITTFLCLENLYKIVSRPQVE